MPPKKHLFLDSNAGMPLHPLAVERLRVFFLAEPEGISPLIANPSSIHALGRRSKRLVSEARDAIARSLGNGVDSEQLIFTSSGTEANQLAIRSALESALDRGEPVHWVTTPVEHDSVLQMRGWLESRGGTVSLLPVTSQGVPILDSLPELLRPETRLISMIWVNNETGVIHPVEDLIRIAREHGVPIHLDAAQAWGKISMDLTALGATYVSFSGHKVGGLAGTGVLALGRGAQVNALLKGKQEKGRRAGTENLVGIVSLGAAAEKVSPADWAPIRALRDRLEAAISERIPGVRINGSGVARVAQTTNLSFEGVVGDGLVIALDLAGIAVSSGSACSSGVLEPSHVLLAMGRSKAEATGAVRVSLTQETKWEDLARFADELERIVSRIRSSRRPEVAL